MFCHLKSFVFNFTIILNKRASLFSVRKSWYKRLPREGVKWHILKKYDGFLLISYVHSRIHLFKKCILVPPPTDTTLWGSRSHNKVDWNYLSKIEISEGKKMSEILHTLRRGREWVLKAYFRKCLNCSPPVSVYVTSDQYKNETVNKLSDVNS